MQLKAAASAFALAFTMAMPSVASAAYKEVTLIHIGDIHGHTTPRDNVRSDSVGRKEGGLARMYTKIKQIRGSEPNALLINTGDTLQGSGEALYSRGQALIDVLDLFGIDAYAPGNWDWVYGKDRFVEFFVTPADKKDPKLKRWGGLAANVYHDLNLNGVLDAGEPLVLPAHRIKLTRNGVKVGIIGCTTNRGPQVVGTNVTKGLVFTDCAKEIPVSVAALRDPDGNGIWDEGNGVDMVLLISEIELGRNIQLVRTTPGIDVILNSDMHEETALPIEVISSDGRKTLIVEEGQDGTMIGEMEVEILNSRVVEWEWKAHRIDDSLTEDYAVKSKVAAVRAPYTTGFKPNTHLNPFNGTYLKGSLDATVGSTQVALHRNGYSDDAMPAVIEGTSHDWIADAIRWWAKSDLATVRGFRYGTHVKPGTSIKRGDLYHYVPIGPRVAKASRINANQLRNQVDNSSLFVLGSDPGKDWAGGWMFAYSGTGFNMNFDAYHVKVVSDPTNAQTTALTSTSRSRAITVTMPCDRLPPAEQAACAGSAQTTLNTLTDGKWTPAWSAPFQLNGVNTPRPIVNLASNGWVYTSTTAGRPFGYPALTVAGYWYTENPDTINNCNNCFPSGTSNDINSPDAPYLLPVNMDPATGFAALDANGNPIYKRDANGVIIRDANNRPQVTGNPIDLTEILEKYLAATGAANPVGPRIKLVHPLPGRDAFNGVPMQQPLCGTIGKDPAAPYICP